MSKGATEMQTEESGFMSWTDERVNLLKTMWAEGNTASQIAKALDITRNAVIGKAHRLGLSGRPSPIRPPDAPAAPAAPVRAKPKKKEDRKGVGLLELTERMCRWPFGDPRDKDFHFCGKPAIPGRTYCGDHCAKAFQAGSNRRGEARAR
jgi:GcrA cell cycle regulator